MIRLLGNKEHEQAYKEAEKQAAEAKVAEQERVTLEKAAQERIAAEREAKAIVDKIEQERIFAENKAKAASGYPLNGMSVEEIVQSLTDGAFSNISTLPSLDTYRKALRILCTSESPVASAFLKERNLKYASFVKGDLIQKVETGESQKWEGPGGQNYNSISLAPFPSDKGKKGFTGSTVHYPKDQLRLLDHESMQIYDLGDSSESGGLSKQNGMDRVAESGMDRASFPMYSHHISTTFAEEFPHLWVAPDTLTPPATPRVGDVVVHKASGAVSTVHNWYADYDAEICFATFSSLDIKKNKSTEGKWEVYANVMDWPKGKYAK